MIRTYDKEEYQREYKILRGLLHPGVYRLLQQLDVIVAGGTLTSLFSNREVNDLDLYFKSWDHLETFLLYVYDLKLGQSCVEESGVPASDLSNKTNMWNENKRCFSRFKELDGIDFKNYKPLISGDQKTEKFSLLENMGMTDKSVMFENDRGPTIQGIAFDVFESAEKIFDKFDFSINMAAFSFKDETWHFERDFLKHLAQKVLVVNPKTDYPIISLLRASKYEARGFTISRREIMKLGVACSNLRVESWDDAKSHLSGMYGTNVEDLFNDPNTFTFDGLFDKLDTAEDAIINDIATKKDKRTGESKDLLEPVTLFEVIHRLRIKTGRSYYKKVFAVCHHEKFYLLSPTKKSQTVHLGMTNLDKGFDEDIRLFTDEVHARDYFGSGRIKKGYFDDGGPGVLLEATVLLPENLIQVGYDNVGVGKECEKPALIIDRFIDANGEIS